MPNLTAYSQFTFTLCNSFMNKKLDNYTNKEKIDIALSHCALNYYLPYQSEQDELAFYNKIRLSQALASTDQEYSSLLLESCSLNQTGKNVLKQTNMQFIFTTFHYCSYRLLPFLLGKAGFDICLVVTKDVLSKQAHQYLDLKQQGNYNIRFKILDAESKTIVKECIKAIRSGYSMLFYIDGNAGVGGMNRRDDSLIEVNFLSKKLLSRKGIAFLSSLTKKPIVPVVANKTSFNKLTFDFAQPLAIPERTDRALQQTTQKIYSKLEPYLRCSPYKWEAWLYLYKWISTSYIQLHQIALTPHTISLRLNKNHFRLIDYGVAKTLLNKVTMRISELSLAEYALLEKLIHPVLLSELTSDERDLMKTDKILNALEENVLW